MECFKIVVITLFAVWVIGTVLAQIDEDYAIRWAMGLVYPIVWVLTYPVRAWRHYGYYKDMYERNGVSRVQYLFGKRIDHRRGKYVFVSGTPMSNPKSK